MKQAALWKSILKDGLIDRLTIGDGESFAHRILRAPIIVDTRPAERLLGQYDWPRFDRIAFPFSECWIETTAPGLHSYVGTLVRSAIVEGDNFISVNMLHVTSRAKTQPTLFGLCKFAVSKSGQLLDIDLDGTWRGCAVALDPCLATYPDASQFVLAATDGALDTLLMLGCKNVSLEQRPNNPDQMRLATRRFGASAYGYRYHVLVVRPATAKLGSPGIDIGSMPRHMCRGHFAEYGPEFGKGLLFGRLAGRFYIPPHLKGRTENGEVAKDYAVASA